MHRKDMSLLSPPQQRMLSNYLLHNLNPTSLCVLLSLYTGLRVGEVCGLMWRDIDFDKSILTVRRTVQRIQNYRQENCSAHTKRHSQHKSYR